MRQPTKKPRPPVGDAVHVTPDEPPPSAPSGAIVLRRPGETRDESLARIRSEIAARTGKARGTQALPVGPFAARSYAAEGQLKAFERDGAEAVWESADGVEAGRWMASPLCAYAIRRDDGSLNPSAVRLVGRWLAGLADERRAA